VFHTPDAYDDADLDVYDDTDIDNESEK